MTKITKIILGGLVFGVAVSSAISASQEDLFISNAKKQHQTMMDSIKAVSKVKASKKDEFIKINQKYLDEFTQSYEVLTSEEKTQIVSSTLTKALNPNEFEKELTQTFVTIGMELGKMKAEGKEVAEKDVRDEFENKGAKKLFEKLYSTKETLEEYYKMAFDLVELLEKQEDPKHKEKAANFKKEIDGCIKWYLGNAKVTATLTEEATIVLLTNQFNQTSEEIAKNMVEATKVVTKMCKGDNAIKVENK